MASAFRIHNNLMHMLVLGKRGSAVAVRHGRMSYYSTTCHCPRQPPSFSRMLDMGGAPTGSTKPNKIGVKNTSKNSKVQGVAFDFELLTLSAALEQETVVAKQPPPKPAAATTTTKPVTPDVARVEEIATLLRTTSNKKSAAEEDDDLSALLGNEPEERRAEATSTTNTNTVVPKKSNDTMLIANKGNLPASLTDIRSKYANKLRKAGVDGGVAGVDLAHYQREESTKKGDAEGHLSARKMAMAQPTSEGAGHSGTRWMALTGTGALLSTLTYRSMKIALLPRTAQMMSVLNHNTNTTERSPKERMVDFTRQLKDVHFDVLVDLPTTTTTSDPTVAVHTMVQSALQKLDLDTKVILFVSDQDAYLRAAKEMGMLTCRIRPRNARRGNVSAHYTVESILEVEQVVNDINGISFNVVLNM